MFGNQPPHPPTFGKIFLKKLFFIPQYIDDNIVNDSDDFVKVVFLCIGVIILIIFLNAWSKTLIIVIGMFKAAFLFLLSPRFPEWFVDVTVMLIICLIRNILAGGTSDRGHGFPTTHDSGEILGKQIIFPW